MPKIVDREQTKRDIAHEAVKLFVKKGYTNFKVSELASICGISKGTIYNYFASKDDIIFGIIESEQDTYDQEIQENIDKSDTIEEKIIALFGLCILDDDMTKIRRKIYSQLISATAKS